MSISWNWDMIIFISFLILNLIVGMYYSRGIKTIKEYAVGNRNFSTSTIVTTIVATFIGGGVFSLSLSKTYTDGLSYIFLNIGEISAFFVTAYFFAPRMAEFLGTLSIAEAMGNLFGKNVRIVTAICSIALTSGAVAMQFKVASTLLGYFFRINSTYATVISGLVVIIYSAGGGIKAVTFTDIIQFLTFGTFIPILALVIWGTLHNPEVVIDTITYNKAFDYKLIFSFDNPQMWNLITLFILFAQPVCFDPAMFQRVSMSKNTLQAKKAFLISGLILIVIYFFMDWIAVLLLSIKKDIPSDSLLSYIIDRYTYPGFKGFILIGIISMLMSTADSYINSSAVMFAHDFCKPLGIKWVKKYELLSSQLFAFTIGVCAIIAALLSANLFSLLILINEFYLPVVAMPILFAVLGFRSSSKSVLIAMVAGAIFMIFWKIISPNTEIEGVIPATITNLVFLIGSHYLLKQPGGWVGIKDPTPLVIAKLERTRKIRSLIINIKEFNLLQACRNNLPIAEVTYTYLGVFIIASTYSSLYIIPEDLRVNYQEIYNFIYHSVLIMSSILLSYPIWPKSFKSENFMAIYWNIAIFYILICVGSTLVIISHFSEIQLMVFMLNLIVMGIILRWQITILMLSLGILLTVKIFKLYTNLQFIPGDFGSIQFKIIYFLLLFSSVTLAFIKPKQKLDELWENYKMDLESKNNSNLFNLLRLSEHKKEFLNKLDQNCIQTFKSLHDEVTELEKNIKVSNKQNLDSERSDLLNIAQRLKNGAEYLEEVIFEINEEVQIKPSVISIEAFFLELIDKYQNFNSSLELSASLKTKNEKFEIDKDLFFNTLTTILDYVRLNLKSNIIHFIIEDSRLEYKLNFTDLLTAKREAIKISIIFKYINSKQEELNKIVNSLDSTHSENFIFNEISKIVKAHYGNIKPDLKEEDEEFAYIITIPARLKEIRPKKKNLPDKQLDSLKEFSNVLSKQTKEMIIEIAKELRKIGLNNKTIAQVTKLNLKHLEDLEI